MALRLRILPYEARFKAAVARVFVDGSTAYRADFPGEHWDAFIKESLDGDLSDIETRYIVKGGNFWVATAPVAGEQQGEEVEEVVGIVGLENKGDGDAELRRMAVSSACRRAGIGRKLVAHLEDWARAQGFARVTLMNGGPRDDARAFYRSLGYRHVSMVVVSQDPLIEVFQLVKDLQTAA
jgi:GNAT superfamily N-acetyltransferase